MAKKYRGRRIVATKTLNKIARATRTELDRAFHEQLAEVARIRDTKLAEAGAACRKAMADARDAHEVARAEAWNEYDERRGVILRSLVAEFAEPEAQAA